MTVAIAPGVAPVRRLLDARFLGLVVLIWTLLRCVSGLILWQVAQHHQDRSVYDDASASGVPIFLEFATLWDGQWYERIATQGYPEQLPVGPQGQVQQNPWAFYPIFPMLARGVMDLTGWSFAVAGVLVATLLGYAAAIVVAGLLREQVGTRGALAGVTLLGAYPSAPTFQVAYTESLALLLLAAALWLLIREQWWAAAGVALLTGLARPVALPLGLVALVLVIARWWDRDQRPLTRGDYAGMLTALLGCGLAGLVWPAYAWWGTGRAGAYTQTMSAWRGGEPVTPFAPSIDLAQWLWGDVLGVLVLALGLGALVLAVVGPWAAGLGLGLRTWCLGYALYLFAALDPWTSLYRYLMLLFPLFVVMAGAGWARAGRREDPPWLVLTRTLVLAGLMIAWQVWWVWYLFRFVPPSDYPP